MEARTENNVQKTEEDHFQSSDEDESVYTDTASTAEEELVDLETAFTDCNTAIQKFFNNDVAGAVELMRPWAGRSLYHSLGIAIFEFIPAMLTFEPNRIKRALAAIKTSISVCNKNKKNFTFAETVGIVTKPKAAEYSDLEAHAELCYAEALLLQAALKIIEGEDLAGIVKGTFKIKTCNSIYNNCLDMIEKRPWETQESKDNFTSGVRLGVGTFGMMISMLPPKIIALMEFAGFSGNKQSAISELQTGSQCPGMRSILCDLVLLIYHLIIYPFAGAQGDYTFSEQLLDKVLKVYPQSIWFLALKARFHLLQGDLDDSVKIYAATSTTEGGIEEFKNLCFWEFMWINALKLDYQNAVHYADLLREKSRWSRTTNAYMKAVMLLQSDPDGTTIDPEFIKCHMNEAVALKTRIAGKSLPMEKFIERRCARYSAQSNKLVLPALELLCIWNLLPVLQKNHLALLDQMLKIIEHTRKNVTTTWKDHLGKYEADNMALVEYVNGGVLAAMGYPLQAIEKYEEAIKYKKDIKEDKFIIPYATCDMAMCHYALKDYSRAMELLTKAKKKYSGYSLESRLYFRVHSRTEMVQQNIDRS